MVMTSYLPETNNIYTIQISLQTASISTATVYTVFSLSPGVDPDSPSKTVKFALPPGTYLTLQDRVGITTPHTSHHSVYIISTMWKCAFLLFFCHFTF